MKRLRIDSSRPDYKAPPSPVGAARPDFVQGADAATHDRVERPEFLRPEPSPTGGREEAIREAISRARAARE